MRRQLAAHTARSLQPHDHALWSGDGACDLYDLARTALGAGARRNERLLFVAIDPDPARLDGVGDLELLLARGQLELHDVEAIYGASGTFSHTEQLETFEGVLEQALAAGYSGMRVVADNTPLVADASEEAYLSWLRWERLTDGFQAASQVTGICYFDDEALDSERLADLAALHPVRAAGATPPRFTFFSDDDAVSVTGALDLWSAERFKRVLRTTTSDQPLVVDLSRAEFVDHRALLALNDAASAARPVRIRGASRVVSEFPSLLGLPAPHLRFERAR
jgi:MEDS: MEthanogen/methylotroph, DcmR Sensory domain/STAS domain